MTTKPESTAGVPRRYQPVWLAAIVFVAYVLLFPVVSRFRVEAKEALPSSIAPPSSKLNTRPEWRFTSDAPPFCRAIIDNPRPRSRCARDEMTASCPDGQVSMFSQYRQDHYLFTRHFRNLPRRGVYADVATNEPRKISNSFFFDACLGWDGLCVEGNSMYHGPIGAQRSCRLVPTCVGDTDGQNVTFVFSRGYGGIADTNKNIQKDKVHPNENNTHVLTCKTMNTAFAEHGVQEVDFMSLDVEGHEMPVLHGIDFDKVVIKVMVVEVSRDTYPEIEKILTGKGYARHLVPREYGLKSAHGVKGLLIEDAIFLHPSVTWGKPE